jgi:hypothetical protein
MNLTSYAIDSASGDDNELEAPNQLARGNSVFRIYRDIDKFSIRPGNIYIYSIRHGTRVSGKRGLTMKYVVAWKVRLGGSAAENEASVARALEIASKWTFPGHATVHQYVLRVDGEGGFVVADHDDVAWPRPGSLQTHSIP